MKAEELFIACPVADQLCFLLLDFLQRRLRRFRFFFQRVQFLTFALDQPGHQRFAVLGFLGFGLVQVHHRHQALSLRILQLRPERRQYRIFRAAQGFRKLLARTGQAEDLLRHLFPAAGLRPFVFHQFGKRRYRRSGFSYRRLLAFVLFAILLFLFRALFRLFCRATAAFHRLRQAVAALDRLLGFHLSVIQRRPRVVGNQHVLGLFVLRILRFLNQAQHLLVQRFDLVQSGHRAGLCRRFLGRSFSRRFVRAFLRRFGDRPVEQAYGSVRQRHGKDTRIIWRQLARILQVVPGLTVHRAVDLAAHPGIGARGDRAGKHTLRDHFVKHLLRQRFDRVGIHDIAVLLAFGGGIILVLLEFVRVRPGQRQQAEAAQRAQPFLAAALLRLVRHDAHITFVTPFFDLGRRKRARLAQERTYPKMAQLLVILLQPGQNQMIDNIHLFLFSFRNSKIRLAGIAANNFDTSVE